MYGGGHVYGGMKGHVYGGGRILGHRTPGVGIYGRIWGSHRIGGIYHRPWTHYSHVYRPWRPYVSYTRPYWRPYYRPT